MSKNHAKSVTCSIVALMLLLGTTVGWAQTAQNVIVEPFTSTSSPYLDFLWSASYTGGTSVMSESGLRWAARRFVTPSAAGNSAYRSRYIQEISSSGELTSFYGWPAGTYVYTIFNSDSPDTGSFDSDTYVDLSTSGAKIVVDFSSITLDDNAAADMVIRQMIRVRDGGDRLWYASEPIDMVGTSTSEVVETVVANVQWVPVNENVILNAMNLNFGTPPNQYSDRPGEGTWPTEINVLTFGSPTTPNFAQVDGGGVYSVAGYDGSSSLIPNGNAHTAITQIKWTSNLQEAELAPSFGHPLSGSQGFNADPDTETVTVNNIGGGTLNISNWELIDENGVFSFTSPGAVSVPGGGSTTVNVTYDPAVGQNPPHLGYLVITSNSFGVSGTTTSLMLVGQPLRQVAKIVDWMPPPGNLTIANANTETPVLTRPWEQAPVGSEERYQGFKWGGNHAGTAATLSLWASGFGGRILFFGSNGTGSSANVPGSYAYTIFDNFGGTTPTKYINLQKITIQNDQTWTGQIIRWLVRDANDNWFLSVGTTNVPLAGPAGAVTVDVDALGGWYAVDATANAEMNELDADADVPIADLGSLTVGSPDLTQVTGAGVYVEFGDEVGVDSARRMFLPDIFTWTKRPDPNETIGLVAGDVSTSNLLVCPNRPIGLVQLIAVFDAGEWEIALDSISCTLTGNGSGAAEIREVLVYTDPNRDGLLGDGELVARGPVSGTTGVATFVDGAFSVTRDSAFDLIYAVLFNDEAIGSTWDVSLQVSDFVLNAAAGGAGDSVVLSGTASAEVTVGSIAIPTGSASFGRTVMAETWDGVATATLPTFDLNVLGSLVGTIPGADNAWDYSLAVVNVVTGGGFRTPSGGTVAAGRETASLTIEPLFYAGVPFTQNLLSPITIGDDTLVGLDFTLYVTGSHASTAVPFTTDGGYGLHPVGTYSDFWLSLNGIYPDESAGGVTLDFFPTTDNDTWAFQVDVDGAEDEQGNLNVWATQKTLAGYGSAGGISTYAVSLQFAPYDENHSIVSMVLTNTATSQADTLVSVMDGRLAEISQVYFNTGGMAANVLIDDIVLTDITVKDQVTNVGTWSIYE